MKINLCQDILPKDFTRFCIDCKHRRNKETCKKCLDWDIRNRPLWEERNRESEKVKEKSKEKIGLLF